MGQYLNPGNDGFASAVNSEIYVDKTGMLEYVNRMIGTEQRWICVSRPRRFGKSITAAMLTAYYGKGCDSGDLFRNLKISQTKAYKEHLNQYDVIHLDINTFRRPGETAGELLRRLNEDVIAELRGAYPETIAEEENYLPAALSQINEKTGTAFFIVIDEWDAIFREYKDDTKAQRQYVDFLRGLFKDEPSKHSVALAYITGILPIKRYNSESALNNFREYTMTSPKRLAEYVGFTEKEVRQLCEQYDMDFAEMQRWYDGYSFSRAEHIYCPNSVANAVFDGEIHSYWSGTVAYESLKSYITMNFDGLKDAVVRMLAGDHLKVNINTFKNDMVSFKNKDDVLTVLIHLGYLAYDDRKKEVYIPNEEVRAAFSDVIQMSDWTQVIQTIQASDALLKATWRKDTDAVAKGIDDVHMSNTSILNYNDENALSCVITLAYYNAMNEYTLIREMPAGKGYADIAFLPRKYSNKPAMVVELKYDKTAGGAISQIKDKQYMKALEEYRGNILLVGINYDKETKKHSCVIEEWEK